MEYTTENTQIATAEHGMTTKRSEKELTLDGKSQAVESPRDRFSEKLLWSSPTKGYTGQVDGDKTSK